MNRALQISASVLFSLAMIAGLLCIIINVVAEDGAYMAEKFAVHADPAVTGVDPKEYPMLAKGITAYLTGKADTMQTALLIHGQQREAYSDRELDHMRDVRALLGICQTVTQICGFLILVCMPLAIVRFPSLRAALARTYIYLTLCLCALGGAAVYWAIRDFDSLFMLFHRLFFTNDLWLLNPQKDLLLQLMPTGFFIDYAADMGLAWLIFAALLFLGAQIYLFIRKRRA